MADDKAQNLQDLRSGDIVRVRTAIDRCRDAGWHADGLLKGIDLAEMDFRHIDLQDADLSRAFLVGTNLSRADLRRASFVDTDLTGADLSEADLREADLTGAILQDANLKDAKLREEPFTLALGLAGATLPDGKTYNGRYRLSGDIKDARRDRVYPDQPGAMAEWYGVSEGEYLEGQEWADLNLEDYLRTAYTMQEADIYEVVDARADGSLTNGSLRGVELDEINLAGCDLSGAKLPDAKLNGAILLGSDFSGTELSGASFIEADMEMIALDGASLRAASLAYANLSRARLCNADLTGADLEGATLIQADLTGAKVEASQLTLADTLTGATLPDGTRYDGRYQLEGDLLNAGDSGLDINDPEQMAEWYDVDIKVYEDVQQWARNNLEKIRPSNLPDIPS